MMLETKKHVSLIQKCGFVISLFIYLFFYISFTIFANSSYKDALTTNNMVHTLRTINLYIIYNIARFNKLNKLNIILITHHALFTKRTLQITYNI